MAEPFSGTTAGTLQYDDPSAYSLLRSAAGPNSYYLAVLVSGLSPASLQTFGVDLGYQTMDGITQVEVDGIGVVQFPEPASMGLLLLGGLPVMLRRRRK